MLRQRQFFAAAVYRSNSGVKLSGKVYKQALTLDGLCTYVMFLMSFFFFSFFTIFFDRGWQPTSLVKTGEERKLDVMRAIFGGGSMMSERKEKDG